MSLIQEGDSLSWSGNTKDPSENAQLITALKEFQRMIGLPVTGLFDDATKAAMNKPRCGVPDKEADSKTTAEHNTTTTGGEGSQLGNSTETDQEQVKDPEQKTAETRLVHTRSERLSRKKRHLASLLGQTRRRREEGEMEYMAFSKAVLRWRLIGEGYSSQLSIDDQRYIFRLAFRMWSEVSPLEFVEDSHSPLEDIDIRLGFGTGLTNKAGILVHHHFNYTLNVWRKKNKNNLFCFINPINAMYELDPLAPFLHFVFSL